MSSRLTAVTPAELLKLPQPMNGRHYELSAGQLIVAGNAGARHERVKQRILTALILWAAQHQTGSVFAESQFTLNEHTARIPDVAFVGPTKLALLPDADVPIPFSPDLAVEIISESESAADAETKVQEYLVAGVAEVWQLYPREQRVRIRRSESIEDLASSQVLDTPILPGFRTPVRDLFSR
ncbi:MAG: Uma2 family endonuclease [Acidobacteriota bacterium]